MQPNRYLVPNNCMPLKDTYLIYLYVLCASAPVQWRINVRHSNIEATVAPPVCFENGTYVDDTVVDDVSSLLLRRNLARMCLLLEIEDE